MKEFVLKGRLTLDGEDLGAASGPESFLLEGKVLLSRRYAGVAVDRHSVAHLYPP